MPGARLALRVQRSVALLRGGLEQHARLLEGGQGAVDLHHARGGKVGDAPPAGDVSGLAFERLERRGDQPGLGEGVKDAKAHHRRHRQPNTARCLQKGSSIGAAGVARPTPQPWRVNVHVV
jgi:hypothetical protein